MKLVLLLLALLVPACGIPSMYKVAELSRPSDGLVAVEQTLERRGYTVDSSPGRLSTQWRYIRLYPESNAEMWVGWQIQVEQHNGEATVKAYCLQQRTANLEVRWWWRKCDPSMKAMAAGSAEDLL